VAKKRVRPKPGEAAVQGSPAPSTAEDHSNQVDAETWKECTICRNIPQFSSEFWKGGELDGKGLPRESLKLEIVGAPYFDDSTSSSNACIKRCPKCGSCYRWHTQYEYLVNGSEDDMSLTRLSDAEGKQAVQQVLNEVKRAKQRFQDEARVHVQSMDPIANQQKVKAAVDFFYHHQLLYNEDISLAVPLLVTALVNHGHHARKCEAGQSLYWLLHEYIKIGTMRANAVLDLLKDVDMTTSPPEVHDLFQACSGNDSK
jgi:hypothetical protein